MIQVVFRSGLFKGTTVLTVMNRQSGREYIDRQAPEVRKDLGILETRNGKNGENGEKANAEEPREGR